MKVAGASFTRLSVPTVNGPPVKDTTEVPVPVSLKLAVAVALLGSVAGVQFDAVPQFPDPILHVSWPIAAPGRISCIATTVDASASKSRFVFNRLCLICCQVGAHPVDSYGDSDSDS